MEKQHVSILFFIVEVKVLAGSLVLRASSGTAPVPEALYRLYTDSCKLPSASITRNCNYSRIEQQQHIQKSLTTEHELKNTIGTKIWKKIHDGKISGGSLWSECFEDFLESHAHLVGPFPASLNNGHQNHRT